MGLFSYLKSSILSKIVMAVTGGIFVLYIIGHTIGNLQIFGPPEMINKYANLLHSSGELLWGVRIVLIVALVLHVVTALRLYALNQSARVVDYKTRKWDKSNLASRTMIWGGLTLFLFLIYHVMHLTMGYTDPTNFKDAIPKDAAQYADVHTMVVKGFQKPLIVVIYALGLVALFGHLYHGFQSMFQTLGFHGPRFTPKIWTISKWFGIIIFILLLAIPLSILFGLVGGN